MNIRILTSLVIVAFALPAFCQELQPAGTHEAYPILRASEVLKPEILKGPYHTVLESVPTQGFSNQYTVNTQWGVYTVFGNTMLLKRIHEFSAIVELEEIAKSDEFKKSLATAAAKPVKAVAGTLTNPVGSIKTFGSGAGKFLRGIGETVDRGGKKSANTGSALDNLSGFSESKRQIAHQLKVDPYTDNAVLQQRLDSVTRASFAGGFIVRAGMIAIPGTAGLAVAAVNVSADLAEEVRDNDATALSAINRKKLLGLGVSKSVASAFVEHPHITPSQQTGITDQLSRIGRIGGIEDYLNMTLQIKNASDAAFFVNTGIMMVVYHEQVSPVKQILNLHGIPAIYATNGALVMPLSIDYISWSEETDRISQAIANYKPGVQITQRLIYVSGIVSPRARRELEAREFVVSDRAAHTVYRN